MLALGPSFHAACNVPSLRQSCSALADKSSDRSLLSQSTLQALNGSQLQLLELFLPLVFLLLAFLSLVAPSPVPLLPCVSVPQELCAAPFFSLVPEAQALVPALAVGSLDAPAPVAPVVGSGGVYAIRGDAFCGYHCAGALGALLQDPRALDSGFECSYEVLAATRKRIFDAYSEWWTAKRAFYATDAEMEEEDVAAHVESSQVFRDRVSGKKEGGLLAWPCDLALYALKTDVLVVVVDAQRVTPVTSDEWDEDKGCVELWFDPVVEAEKKRVICVVMDNAHFDLAVVRTPGLRFIFDRGTDWVRARRLILNFVKFRVPGAPLGPKWVPPAGSLLALRLVSCASVSESDARDIEAMESKALLTVQVESERELSSTHTHTFSLSSPSFCRYKTASPIPPVSSFPNQAKNKSVQSPNVKLVQSSTSKCVQSYESVERREEAKIERGASQLPANENNKESRSGVVESGEIFYSDERGGGEREGPKHSLMNTTHIDYHTHRFGANKSKAQVKHKVFPGSAKDGNAKQGLSTLEVEPAKSMGARHYNSNRGENVKHYISSSSSSYNNSRPPHSNPAMECTSIFTCPATEGPGSI